MPAERGYRKRGAFLTLCIDHTRKNREQDEYLFHFKSVRPCDAICRSITKIQRNHHLDTDVPAHVEDTDTARCIIDRVILEPAHIIHITGIE